MIKYKFEATLPDFASRGINVFIQSTDISSAITIDGLDLKVRIIDNSIDTFIYKDKSYKELMNSNLLVSQLRINTIYGVENHIAFILREFLKTQRVSVNDLIKGGEFFSAYPKYNGWVDVTSFNPQPDLTNVGFGVVAKTQRGEDFYLGDMGVLNEVGEMYYQAQPRATFNNREMADLWNIVNQLYTWN